MAGTERAAVWQAIVPDGAPYGVQRDRLHFVGALAEIRAIAAPPAWREGDVR